MRESTVAVANGRFNVEVLEAGDGPDVVYLHGAMGLTWDAFLGGLSERYHVIAPRLPGTGKSTGVQRLLDHHDAFYFLLDFLDARGLDPVRLVGHCLGGWLATEVAAMQPARVQRLVVMDALGLWNDAYPVADFFAMVPAELAKALYHDPQHPAAQALTSPAMMEQSAMVDRAKNLSTAARFLWPIPDKGLSNRIHRVKSPTLIVWGASDGVAPVRYAADFQRSIAGSTVQVIERAGHLPQVEQTATTLAAIRKFLA